MKGNEIIILGLTLTVCLIVLTIFLGCSLVPKSEFDECNEIRIEQANEIKGLDVQKSVLEVQLSELEAEKLSINSTIKAKIAEMIELEEELYNVRMERGFFPKVEMTITPNVMSPEYIKDIMDEKGRVKGIMNIEELNGVGFKVKEIHSVFYKSSGSIYHELYTDIPALFGKDCYFDPLGRSVGRYRFRYSDKIEYVIYSFKGIDDYGNEFGVSCRLNILK